MKIAIDIDGTITAWPKQFADILSKYEDAIILTGSLDIRSSMFDLLSQRREQLKPLLGDIKHKIMICVGKDLGQVAQLKGLYCRNNNIDVLFDDDQSYCSAVRAISPNTLVLKVIGNETS